MNKIDDELLNRYIDNELDGVELSELKAVLDKDTNALTRLKALRTVDGSLKDLQNEVAPESFTDRLMNKIQATANVVKPKISYFFISVITIFSIAILATLVFAFKGMKIDNSQSNIDPLLDQIKVFAGRSISVIDAMFKNNSILLVGGMLAVIMLSTAIFTFDAHKNFKNKLNSISR